MVGATLANMRALSGFLALSALAAFPAAARADAPVCDPTPASAAWQIPLGTSVGAAYNAAYHGLGDQFVMSFMEHSTQRWGVAYSAGTLDDAGARATIRERLAATEAPARVEALMAALKLVPTRYSRAELEPIRDALWAAVNREGRLALISLDCHASDAVRVLVSFNVPDTPELRAQVEPLLAPYGDKVRLEFGGNWSMTGSTPAPPPAPPAAPAPAPSPSPKPALRVREHVRLPTTARCVRGGTLTIKPGKSVQRLRLAAGSRTATARNGKAAKLKLTARRTKVTVTATLADGGTATQTFTYRRCA